MPTKTKTDAKTKIEELRRELAAAKTREIDLARELDAIGERIKDAAKRATRERAAAAREGKSAAATVEGDREVEELERRRGVLPFERWGARVHRAELERQLHLAEAEVNREVLPELQAAHQEAKRALEEARDAEQIAYGAMMRVMRAAERASSAATKSCRIRSPSLGAASPRGFRS